METRNIILLTIDALRHDYVRCYNEDCKLMPFLSEIGKKSIMFENAITANGRTVPSLSSIHTSTYSNIHGLQLNGQKLENFELPTLAEILNKEGYNTIGAVGVELLNSRYYLNRGYHKYFDHKFIDKYITKMGYKKYHLLNILRKLKIIHPKNYHTVDGFKINSKIKRYLSRSNNKNMFLWIHYIDILRLRQINGYESREKGIKPSKKDFLNWYNEGVKNIDSILEDTFRFFDEKNILDNSIIIITADHGQHLFQRIEGFLSHGYSLYDEDIKVPLLIYAPNYLKPMKVKHVVRSIDILPTILEGLNISFNNKIQGKSLIPIIKNEEKVYRGIVRAD